MVDALGSLAIALLMPSLLSTQSLSMIATHLFQTIFWISVQFWQYSLGNIVMILAWVHTFPSINTYIGDTTFLEEKSESEKLCVKEC